MAEGYFTIQFDDQGHLLHLDEQETILRALLATTRPVTDLWLFSHGWRTDKQHADEMYENWVRIMQQRIAQEIADATYNPLFVGIYWPSLDGADDIHDQSAPTLYAPNDIDLSALEIGADEIVMGDEPGRFNPTEFPFEIGGSESAEIPRVEIDGSRMTNMPPSIDEFIKVTDKAHFVEAYRAMLNPGGQHMDQYEQDFAHLYDIMLQSPHLTRRQIEEFVAILYRYQVDDPHSDPSEQTNILRAPERVVAQLYAESSAATQYEVFRPGNKLHEFLDLFTFWTMKGRSAVVGENGVAPFLLTVKEILRKQNRPVRMHLMGHSFGAKLVSATVYGLANLANGASLQPPLVDNLILLLGAFSQFAFSRTIPFKPGSSGKYANIIEHHLVANPIVAIYSRHDRANKTLYPQAMLRDSSGQTYERGGPEDRLGAIGANGAQGLDAAISRIIELQPVEIAYDRASFSGLSCLNIDGQHYINKVTGSRFVGAHGDIYRPEIFHLVLAVSRQ